MSIDTLKAADDKCVEGFVAALREWIIFINGEELGRVEWRENIARALSIEGPRPRGLLSRMRALLGGRR